MSKEVKLVVVGAGAVGKSTLVIQYIDDSFRKQETIAGESVILDILDYSDVEEFSCMWEQYFRHGQGFVMCISLTDNESLNMMEKFVQRILRVKDLPEYERVPMVLVGTKSDLPRQVAPGEIHALASKYDVPYVETSAKTNTNVKEAFHAITTIVLESQQSGIVKKNSKGQKKDVVCSLQ